METIKQFRDTLKMLTKNPLGIVALLIVLIYGFALLVVGFSAKLQPDELLPLIWFLAVFPVIVLGIFAWLVSRHHLKLFSSLDSNEIEKQQDILPSFNDPDPIAQFHAVDIFYATDRISKGGSDPATFFGTDFGELSFGTAHVTIPVGHRPGRLESPSIIRLQFKPDPGKHVVLLKVQPLSSQRWIEQLSGLGANSALVFVHGYNVTFEDGARRTAQLKWDLNFRGPAILYSWPSKGKLKGYVADEETIQLTAKNLKTVLEFVKNKTDITDIHVIAHSMGSRALVDVLSEFADSHPVVSFQQVILAAPDINTKIFCDEIAPKIRIAADRMSLYASSNDTALKASKSIHTYARAGESGDNLVIVEGIDTIDASKVDTNLLGHGYFAESKQVIDDIFQVIHYGFSPERRNLKRRKRGSDEYWVLP